jgi:DNA helicase-2/ATP-dependent DNA helicase PcrA
MNRIDDAACERILNIPPRGIGNKSIEVVRAFAREHGSSIWQAIVQVVEQQLLPARACTALQNFLQLIDQLALDIEQQELDELVDTVIKTVELRPFFEKEKGEKAQARLENLDELITAASEFIIEQSDDLSPLQQFLDNAALDAGDGQADEFEDSIQLMTLHSAKGLEFKQVYLVGMEENLFPHKMSLEEPGRLQEERRLCYVGVTRAREKLFLSYAEMRRLHGTDNYNRPSRFIREFPEETLREVRLNASVKRPVASSNSYLKQEAMADSGLQGLALGARVTHPKFGEGVLLNFEGQGPSSRVQVNFDEVGSKWLVLQYARLDVIA